jgi:hypothetical protein
MLNLSISCTRFERNYSSCIGRSSENLLSKQWRRSGKKKEGLKLRKPSNGFLSFTPPTFTQCVPADLPKHGRSFFSKSTFLSDL